MHGLQAGVRLDMGTSTLPFILRRCACESPAVEKAWRVEHGNRGSKAVFVPLETRPSQVLLELRD